MYNSSKYCFSHKAPGLLEEFETSEHNKHKSNTKYKRHEKNKEVAKGYNATYYAKRRKKTDTSHLSNSPATCEVCEDAEELQGNAGKQD